MSIWLETTVFFSFLAISIQPVFLQFLCINIGRNRQGYDLEVAFIVSTCVFTSQSVQNQAANELESYDHQVTVPCRSLLLLTQQLSVQRESRTPLGWSGQSETDTRSQCAWRGNACSKSVVNTCVTCAETSHTVPFPRLRQSNTNRAYDKIAAHYQT